MQHKDDFLATLPVGEVANWHMRSAEQAGNERIGGQIPLASTFLKKYLTNRNKKTIYRFHPPGYLINLKQVLDTLKYHRAVFLTEDEARIGKKPFQKKVWAGLRPRLQGSAPYQKWDVANDPKVYLEYESLVEIGRNLLDIIRIQQKGSKPEKDIFGSLRGFQLISKVMVTGELLSKSRAKVRFSFWQCEVKDTYDFDYKEHLTFLNPDYQKHFDPKAVCPQSKWLKVYHSNAKRLEDAGLGCPYEIHSYTWTVNDPAITGPTEVEF